LLIFLSASQSFGEPGIAARCGGLPRPGAVTAAGASTGPASALEEDRLQKLAGERYRQQDFGAALDALESAYALRPSAAILYNMAQACREAGAEKEAMGLYEQAARRTPDSLLRAEATRRLTELRRKQARAEDQRLLAEQQELLKTQQAMLQEQQRLLAEQRAAAALVPPSPAKPPKQPDPVYKRWWFWTALGGAAAAVAVVSGALAYSFPRDPSYPNPAQVSFK
jgi:tetratricopeptide (TPR) repeat protein